MDIGLITGAFGIKGEVRILSLNDEPERFLDLESVIIVGPDGDETTCRIEKARIHKRHALVRLEGIRDRDRAESMKGSYVRLAGGDMTIAEEARIERDKLIGLEVFTRSGDRLGIIEEVIRTGANDVYEVVYEDRSILLPAISDVIAEVDIENGRMIVDPLPGLL
jgi:16S rRNA processing protein RimM